MKNLVILGAGQGTRLRPLTDEKPKCLVELAGRPLLDWALRAGREAGFEKLVVVRGYKGEAIEAPGVVLVDNPAYDSTNMVASLWCAEAEFGDGIVVSYGDIAYEVGHLEAIRDAGDGVAVLVDREWRSYWEARFEDVLGDAESLVIDGDRRIRSIGQKATDIDAIEAQYIGLLSFSGPGLAAARDLYERVRTGGEVPARLRGRRAEDMYMTDLLQGLVDEGVAVRAVEIGGGWVEVDSPSDLALAERYARVEDGALRIDREGAA